MPSNRLPANWIRYRYLPLIVGVVGMALATSLAWVVINISHTKARAEIAVQAQNHLLQIRDRMDRQLQSTLSVPETVAAFVAAQGRMPPDIFATVVGRLLERQRNIRNLALAPDNVITDIYPRLGNEKALGLRYMDNPQQRGAVERAIQTRRTVVAGPIQLVQGGLGITSRTPVFLPPVLDGKHNPEPAYWGIVSLTMNADTLFADVGLTTDQMGFQVAARGKDATGAGGAVFLGHADLFDANPVTLEVPLPGGGSWLLGAVPNGGWRAAGSAPTLVVWLSYAFAVLLGLLGARLMRAHQQVLALASHDRLTGLPNRRLFEDRLSQAVLTAHRDHRPGALLLIDLDGFKPVNDSLGHRSGDQVLARVGQRLQGLARANDTAARIGGDEFALVLNAVSSPEAAMEVAHKVLQTMLTPVGLDNGEHVSMGASIGVAIFLGGTVESLPNLMDRADQALYESKRNGKGTASMAPLAVRDTAAQAD
ncbi:diguanylate cyclase (GGDEF) domain-containing protein [Rhodoferax sp. OV413]|uniref:diguanylate cyclase domain-containing protein n=1 Tax=Rhodoferax sp. OV413 TaxID=1855285 RepID=UPI00089170BE|nr:diguanylate cyclase [Rhodoferax sp. OV413]SDP68596.1 diguanylate cyclase (GGDEF) domain-containing protein [Rhodoferax sp. OV413]